MKKSVFQLLVVDGGFSALSCLMQLVINILMLAVEKNMVICQMYMLSFGLCNFLGIVLTFEIAFIRYLGKYQNFVTNIAFLTVNPYVPSSCYGILSQNKA